VSRVAAIIAARRRARPRQVVRGSLLERRLDKIGAKIEEEGRRASRGPAEPDKAHTAHEAAEPAVPRAGRLEAAACDSTRSTPSCGGASVVSGIEEKASRPK